MIKCTKCQQEKEESEFRIRDGKLTYPCKQCNNNTRRKGAQCPEKKKQLNAANKQWRDGRTNDQIAKRSQKVREYREKNKARIRELRKNYHQKKKDENPNHWREYAKKYRGKYYNSESSRRHASNYYHNIVKNDPALLIHKKIRSMIYNLSKGKKISRSLEYAGVSSAEEFIKLLSEKTDDKLWFMKEGYHIDHIWQVDWFSGILKNSDSPYFQEVLMLVNHHSNLRPLKALDNVSRSMYDFYSLTEFEKFKPFLDKRIILAFEFYQKNFHNLNRMLFRGESEDWQMINYLASIGGAD
jgi:hypothetical protein